MFKLLFGTSIVSTIIAGGVWGIGGVLFVLAIISTIFVLALVKRHAQVTVGEMEVAVVYNQQGDKFSHFLPSGIHWINPAVEEIRSTISTNGQSTSGQARGLQSSGGLPIAIKWTAQFSINPMSIGRDKAPKMARALPFKAQSIVEKHVNHILHHLIDTYTIQDLIEPGAHQKIERQIRQQLTARLESAGFTITRIMVDSIQKPKHVVAALEAAHERALQAEQEANALERLHKVVSQFSDADMQRLMELERIHMLGRNGVTMVYPAMHDSAATSKRTQSPLYSSQTVILDPLS